MTRAIDYSDEDMGGLASPIYQWERGHDRWGRVASYGFREARTCVPMQAGLYEVRRKHGFTVRQMRQG